MRERLLKKHRIQVSSGADCMPLPAYSVDKASYTIFLKGRACFPLIAPNVLSLFMGHPSHTVYFDTGILRFARWPITPTFQRLSLVQDPIPSYRDLVAAAYEAGISAPSKSHAQPIVFFKLSCLSTLAASPVSAHVSSLRLRIPGRSVLVPLCSASTSSTVLPPTHSAALPKPFPALEHLDISTTYVGLDGAFQALLKRHPGMRHMVLDRSGLIRVGMPEHTCAEIGRTIATAGVARATEAMKIFRAAMRAQQARLEARRRSQQAEAHAAGAFEENAQQRAVEERNQEQFRAARRGRSAFATERRPRGAPGGMGAGNAGSAEMDELDETLANLAIGSEGASSEPAQSSGSTESPSSGSPVVAKPVILPSAPALLCLSCGVSPHPELDDALRSEWDAEFSLGFSEGKERVVSFIREKLDEYARLCTRSRNALANHRSAPEDRIAPTLVRFRTPAERKLRQKIAAQRGMAVEELDGRIRDILGVLDLVTCEVADALELIAQVEESNCELCTVPDCAGSGRIASTTSEEEDRREVQSWRRADREHKKDCGHLIGRQIWEEEHVTQA